MSDSVWPHRWQLTRLPSPWDSPGKNTGVGCHFLLQCMKVKSESEVAQSCPTLSDPMDCSLPGSSVHGIFQARVLEWGAIAFSEAKCYRDTKIYHSKPTTPGIHEHNLNNLVSLSPKQTGLTDLKGPLIQRKLRKVLCYRYYSGTNRILMTGKSKFKY